MVSVKYMLERKSYPVKHCNGWRITAIAVESIGIQTPPEKCILDEAEALIVP